MLTNTWYQAKSTAKEISFEWSHHRILSINSKVIATLHVSIIESGSQMVKYAKGGVNTEKCFVQKPSRNFLAPLEDGFCEQLRAGGDKLGNATKNIFTITVQL